MKKLMIAACLFGTLAFAACKGNPDTTSGDSSGTGAGGARVPGNTVSDTTHKGSVPGSPSTDTAKKTDTVTKK
jgi:hypothetical protein